MPACVWIFVNEDLSGNAIAIALEDAELIEINGKLYPMLEMSPAYAMRTAEALVKCSGQVVKEAMD